jgi:ubiquinone/menaquinone biosynthesis C-methylase UbiE
MDDTIYTDPELAQFYDIENSWSADRNYCLGLSKNCSSVLDLGCGTGSLAVEIARSGVSHVVGVDPASAMLNIARNRDGGNHVTWIEADARSLRLEQKFDLIVLTGHAFQCLLTKQDQFAALQTIACHLAPNGKFIFDTRNPLVEEWKEWTPELSRRKVQHPKFGEVDAWYDAAMDEASQIVTYETHYEVLKTGRDIHSRSQIAFPPQRQLAVLITDAGLDVERWLGDWDASDWHEAAKETIPYGRLS